MSQSPATLYYDGVEIGSCLVNLPELEPAPLPPLSFSQTVTWQTKPGKKTRKMARWLRELFMSTRSRAYVQHYRRVKHAQLRKQWAKKR